MVELEKPSTLFKVAQGPEGRYFFSVKTSIASQSTISAETISSARTRSQFLRLHKWLNQGSAQNIAIPVKVCIPRFLEHRKQLESGIEEIAFFDYDPQGRTKFYHVDD